METVNQFDIAIQRARDASRRAHLIAADLRRIADAAYEAARDADGVLDQTLDEARIAEEP